MRSGDTAVTLYKYHRVDKYALSALARKQIWLTNPKHFNDPFDCRPDAHSIAVPSGVVRNETEGRGRTLSYTGIITSPLGPEHRKWVGCMGVYCMSACAENRLMWSHYADAYTGFCLRYEFDDETKSELVEVLYEAPKSFTDDDQLEFIKKVARFKAEDWEYENEYRWVFKKGGRYEDRPAPITGVIFGSQCEDNDRDTVGRLLGEDVERMRVKMDGFALKIEPSDD